MQKLFISIGSGPGIGLSTAIRFAKEGFIPVLASRDASKLKSLADEVKQATGQDAELFQLDAGNSEQIAALAERYSKATAVLHYNAAVKLPRHITELSFDALSTDIQVGITGALAAIKAFSPAMVQQKQGTILLTGGGLALYPSPEFLTLSIAKAGIRCMSQALFDELAANNVHIGSVTVTKVVEAGSEDAENIAEAFWKIHNSQPAQGTMDLGRNLLIPLCTIRERAPCL